MVSTESQSIAKSYMRRGVSCKTLVLDNSASAKCIFLHFQTSRTENISEGRVGVPGQTVRSKI